MSEKIRKKDIQAAKAPDAVLVGATSMFDWIVERRNLLIGVLVVVAVVAIAFSVTSGHKEETAKAQGVKLSEAMALERKPIIEGATGKDSFPSQEAKTKALREAFESIIKEDAGSDAARSAGLALGRIELDAGAADAAVARFETYLGQVKKGGMRLFALESLGYAYEAKGDRTKAADAFAKLADEGAPGRALFHKARLAEEAGQKDEARKLYEQVVAEYATDAISQEASGRLELLDLPPAGEGGFEKSDAP